MEPTCTFECNAPVSTVTLSPDGQWMATSDDNYCLKIWPISDTAAQAPHQVISMSSFIWCTALCSSASGNYVAAGHQSGVVKIWCVDTGNLQASTNTGDNNCITSVVFSPLSRNGCNSTLLLATASNDWTARIWRVSGLKATEQTQPVCLHTLRGHNGWVRSVAYSPDGQRLFTGSSDHTIKVWCTSTGSAVADMSAEGYCSSIAISPDGRVIAANAENTVRLLNIGTRAVIGLLLGHCKLVRSLGFVSNHLLVSCAHDHAVKLWWARGPGVGTCVATLGGPFRSLHTVSVSPGVFTLATTSASKTAAGLWDITAYSLEARVLVLVLLGRRRRLPHVPQELWMLITADYC